MSIPMAENMRENTSETKEAVLGLLYGKNSENDLLKSIRPDGDKYIGVWEHESRNGPGVLIKVDGTRVEMTWKEKRTNYALVPPDKYPEDEKDKT